MRMRGVAAALILTGAPGAGKSAVLDALGTLLELLALEHGALESLELTRGFPPLATAMRERRLL